ncbi:MAG: hypothetical protein AAFX93_08785 [Verrucomicrobiota bacterium]
MNDHSQPTREEIYDWLKRIRMLRMVRITALTSLISAFVLNSVYLWLMGAPEGSTGWLMVGLWAAITALTAAMTWRDCGDLPTLARKTEQRLPVIGLRLTSSLESGDNPHADPDIDAAVWQEAAAATIQEETNQRAMQTGFTLACVTAIAIATLSFLSIYVVIPGLSAIAPAVTLNPKEIVEEEVEPAIPQELIAASITIQEPGEDFWATRIEAVPLELTTDSPHGFSDLTIKASVNGGDWVTLSDSAEFVEAGEQALSLELYLDELKIEDFDLVSYAVEGLALHPEHPGALRRSDMYFIQIRPFDWQITKVPTAEGDMQQMIQLMNLLIWLIEEERIVIRHTWVLNREESAYAGTAEFNRAAGFVRDSQQMVQDRLLEAIDLFTNELQEQLPGPFLAKFNESSDHFDQAIQYLDNENWAEAGQEEQRGLADLIYLYSMIQRIVGEGAASPSSGEPEEGEAKPKDSQNKNEQKKLAGLEDRQLVRRQSSKIAQLQEEQEKLNREMEELQDPFADIPEKEYYEKKQELEEKQAELKKEAESMASSKGSSSSEAMKQASKAMEENEEDIADAQPGEQTGEAGQQAQEMLAAAKAISESQERQALNEAISRMMKDISESLAEEDSDDGEVNDLLSDYAEQIEATAMEEPSKEIAAALNEAAEDMNTAASKRGSEEAVATAMESLAEARQVTAGELESLRELEQALARMKRQLRGAKRQAEAQAQAKADGQQQAQSEESKGESSGQGSGEGSGESEWQKAQQGDAARLRAEVAAATGDGELAKQLEEDIRSMGSASGQPSEERSESGSGGDEKQYTDQEVDPNFNPVFKQIGGIENTVDEVLAVIRERYASLQQKDLLVGGDQERIAEQYREMVAAYFEKLSRETGAGDESPKE